MADLDIVTVLWCPTNVSWQTKVTGSKGDVYTVSYDMGLGWHCTCPAFQHAKGELGTKACKHTKKVEASKERCAWGESALWNSPEPRPADGKCPCCGEVLSALRIAI